MGRRTPPAGIYTESVEMFSKSANCDSFTACQAQDLPRGRLSNGRSAHQTHILENIHGNVEFQDRYCVAINAETVPKARLSIRLSLLRTANPGKQEARVTIHWPSKKDVIRAQGLESGSEALSVDTKACSKIS